MATSNPSYNASDRILLMTITLLLILLLVFVFALINISTTYQNKQQQYKALIEPHPDSPQLAASVPAPVTAPPASVVVPLSKPEYVPSKTVDAQPPAPRRASKPPVSTATVAAASPPEKPNPTTKKQTRVAQPNRETGYLKLAQNGHILPDNATEWACVQDRATGLFWEVKTDDNSMRDRDNFFSWYVPAAEHNHGQAGARNGGRCKGRADCDTQAYVQALNQQQLCGFSDWRLPSRDEMLSLVSHNDSSKGTRARINTDYFPKTLASWYWTASSNPDKPDYAWFVLFRNGQALNALKHHPKHVRLVRAAASEKKTLNPRLALNQ